MGNHCIDCDYCGEDTRGLSGVRGCNSQEEAQGCYTYQQVQDAQRIRDAYRVAARGPVATPPAPASQSDQPGSLVEKIATFFQSDPAFNNHLRGLYPGAERALAERLVAGPLAGLPQAVPSVPAADPAVPEGHVIVPVDPGPDMWDGLARQIVMWLLMSDHSGKALHDHLHRSGHEIPDWLLEEIPCDFRCPAKGTIAVVIYRAMVERRK